MDEIFDESHYFVCSGGLKPASMKSNQNIVKREDGKYYLTEYSLKCYAIDFSCKWVALLYAIVAAALALLLSCPAGWVLLAAIIGAGVGAALGAAMCGDMAAIMRVWVAIKTDAQLGEHNAVANKPGVHMICNAFSGQITYVPNVKSEFHALVLFAGNTLMTGLEGFMYVYAFRGAGMLITKPLQFFANFGVNYLKTVSVAGFAGRTVFGAWGGFSAYSNSSTEGFHAEEVFTDAGKSFGFAEMAAYHAVTERDPQSIALLLSLGGIPGGRNSKDANGLADVKAQGNAAVDSWKNAGEKVANELIKAKNAARDFRERLKSQKKGNGAHEKSVYETKALENDYIGEELGEGWVEPFGTKVKYLSAAEKAPYELFVKDGKIVDAKGNLYDTKDAGTAHSGKGKSIFVMDENGRIYASKTHAVGEFHHSSLGGGKPVAGAGEIVVDNGKVTEISNRSGHYQPDQRTNAQVLEELKSREVDITDIKIEGY